MCWINEWNLLGIDNITHYFRYGKSLPQLAGFLTPSPFFSTLAPCFWNLIWWFILIWLFLIWISVVLRVIPRAFVTFCLLLWLMHAPLFSYSPPVPFMNALIIMREWYIISSWSSQYLNFNVKFDFLSFVFFF